MARTNGPIQVWHRTDTIPSDSEGGYAGGDSTAAAVGTSLAQAGRAVATVDNLSATATELPPGSDPTVTVTGPIPNKVINIGIPRGEPGMGYEEGQQLLNQNAATLTAAQTAATDADSAATRAENAEGAALAPAAEVIADTMSNSTTAAVRRSGVLTPTAVTHEAVQAACTAAATFGLQVRAGGTYTTDQTLNVTSDVDLGGLVITYTGTGTAVRVGTESGVTWRLKGTLPRVIKSGKSGAGWSSVAGSVGYDLVNLNSCSMLVLPHARNFETGLLERGVGTGISYNNVHIGHLENCKINQRMTADATGWANQNQHYGGRLSHGAAEGTRVAGVRHVLLDDGLVSACNNNSWSGTSFEGTVTEYHLECSGQTNVFLNCRWEVQGANVPRVRWVNAYRNAILYGFEAEQIEEAFSGTTYGNQIVTGQRSKVVGSSAGPITVWENQGSSSYPALALLAAGQTVAGSDPTTAYSWLWSAKQLKAKRAGDTQDRLVLDADFGRVLVGNGSAAAAVGIMGSAGSTGVTWAGSMVPTVDATYNLGSAASRFFDGYFSRDLTAGRYVRVGSLTLRDNNGTLQVSSDGTTWKTVNLT